MSFFRDSLQREMQAAALASLLLASRLLSRSSGPEGLTCEELDRVCNVFDTFVDICAKTEISFEHAWFLRQTLVTDNNYALVPCQTCQALWIRDRLAFSPNVCPWCRCPRVIVELDTPRSEVSVRRASSTVH